MAHPCLHQGQPDLLGIKRKIILSKETAAAQGQPTGLRAQPGGHGHSFSSASSSISKAGFRGKEEQVLVYLWRKFSYVVAEEGAGSPNCMDINILITIKCRRMAGVSNV